MIDLHPTTDRVAAVLGGLTDADLARPTPCGTASVGAVLDHLGMFARNFAMVAGKELDEVTSTPPAAFDAANLGDGWRERLVGELAALADAWSADDAWQGTTWVGGMHVPGEVAGVIALDELLVHGWDLAVATGQDYDPPVHEIEVAIPFVEAFPAPRDGRLFGPVVDVDPDASPFDRLLGLTGRDPAWQPA